ncbi:MAG: UDP-N-acetylglucosamine 4,6-dehydratase (inverting) [Acidobacteriota bacterium]|nr:UDP-N-acetylglucosamine 4,6-dehydratase (inverting) [Acidobacteriota bacterium]
MNGTYLDGKVVLITGGTGSFGRAMTRYLLDHHNVKTIRIFSRDEFKQFELQRELSDSRLRFLLGDVRDRERVRRACEGVDIIFNAAALKQVPMCEYNPFEAIQTNIMGAMSVVDSAIDAGAERVITISTDKAVSPVNLYGATKLCAEKVFIHGNSYSGRRKIKLGCVRYGNVVGSRGSVLPLFLDQRRTHRLTITDLRMTRFWITLDAAVRFVVRSMELMVGGEIFVPKLPSMRILDLAYAVDPGAEIAEIGARQGEKLHETLVMREEAGHTVEYGDSYIILPEWYNTEVQRPYMGRFLNEEFTYTSENNTQWLSREEMARIIADYEKQHGE